MYLLFWGAACKRPLAVCCKECLILFPARINPPDRFYFLLLISPMKRLAMSGYIFHVTKYDLVRKHDATTQWFHQRSLLVKSMAVHPICHQGLSFTASAVFLFLWTVHVTWPWRCSLVWSHLRCTQPDVRMAVTSLEITQSVSSRLGVQRCYVSSSSSVFFCWAQVNNGQQNCCST